MDTETLKKLFNDYMAKITAMIPVEDDEESDEECVSSEELQDLKDLFCGYVAKIEEWLDSDKDESDEDNEEDEEDSSCADEDESDEDEEDEDEDEDEDVSDIKEVPAVEIVKPTDIPVDIRVVTVKARPPVTPGEFDPLAIDPPVGRRKGKRK